METSLNLALKFIVSLVDFLVRNTRWLHLLIAFSFASLKIISTERTEVVAQSSERLLLFIADSFAVLNNFLARSTRRLWHRVHRGCCC